MNASRLDLSRLQKAIGYSFSDQERLREALTHSTYAYEQHRIDAWDNERLEFLGDAVLDLVISDMLFHHEERLEEGLMTQKRALVVRETTLAQVAYHLDLGRYLLLGKGEDATGGRLKPSNLSNAVEAILGAIYLDGGLEPVFDVIRRLFEEPLTLALSGDLVYDYKSRLLERIQSSRGSSTLKFQILDESGPVHERLFTAGILVDDQLIATGTGTSKKDAEQEASKKALDRLECDQNGCTHPDKR